MLDKLVRYDGKRVVVTGGASGIGKATVEALLGLGAEVFALDIIETDVGSQFVHVDLLDPTSVDRAVETVGGPIHALFNVAGLTNFSDGVRINSTADVIACNFAAMRHMIDRVVPLMPTGSAIVSVSSTSGVDWRAFIAELRPLVETPDIRSARAWAEAHASGYDHIPGADYAIAKMALHLYTALKAPQLAPLGIRINTLSPSATLTAMYHAGVKGLGEEPLRRGHGPAGRPARPEEQAHCLAFLNSDAAAYVTGIDLRADGGWYAANDPAIAGIDLPPIAR